MKKVSKYILLIIVFLPLLYFRDFTPNNELKYLSIADEALRSGTYLTFTHEGSIYTDKPPLYLWLIMLCKQLLGHHSMLLLGLFSFIPALLILYIMEKWLSPYIPSNYLFTFSLMLITTGLFAGSAIVLRMDMLMSLFILLALYTFYRMYTGQAGKGAKVLLPLYIFLALFTKGPLGLIIPFFSILVFLLYQKEGKTFFSYFGLLQWFILVGLCSVWFLGVYWEGGSNYLYNLVFHQTLDRAMDSFHHKEPFYYYFTTIWYALAPWSLLYIFVPAIALWKRQLKSNIEKFFLTILVANFLLLSLFSSKLDIYLLPIFPFFAGLTILLLKRFFERTVSFTIAVPALLFALSLPASYFFITQTEWHYPVSLQIAIFLLSAAALLSLYYLYRKKILYAIRSLAGGIILVIFIGGFYIPHLNPYIGFREICREAAQIAAQQNIDHYYYYNFRSGENMDVYLKTEVKEIRIYEIPEIAQRENFILFLRNKDIRRNPALPPLLPQDHSIDCGNYRIVLFRKLQQENLPAENNPIKSLSFR